MAAAKVAKRVAGILIFEGFEVLDIYGPIECLHKLPEGELSMAIVAEKTGPIRSIQGMSTIAEYSFANCPSLDILLIPGGMGTRKEVDNENMLKWVKEKSQATEWVLSVCTGAAILAKTGLLDGLKATTNKRSFRWVTGYGKNVDWVAEARWIHSGKYWTSSGVSAGTDMTLAFIEHIWGKAAADQATMIMEWDRKTDSTWDPFARVHGLVPAKL